MPLKTLRADKMNNTNAQDGSADEGCTKPSATAPLSPKVKPRKRARMSSVEDTLPENTVEMEMKLQAVAIKNNLDDVSVKKILRKVVTNDHVLALVKLQEEEELATEESDVRPKLTRAKAKELMKVSPKSKEPWNIENLALTPIKHIPVKTTPEVTSLIDQELPDDEDDEEYKPNQDDAISDEEHTESDMTFSDVDSQPRTPATPATPRQTSPRHKEGPFKVPQNIRTPSRRLFREEENSATIALRTRSKLSLSATPIEHIESSFVPPDELPLPEIDDLWNQFLEECMDPAGTSKPEDDDEADPEYNVAADPDAQEDDEEGLDRSILKISQKEINDLVNELLHIMPNDDEIDDKNVENTTQDNQINGKNVNANDAAKDNEHSINTTVNENNEKATDVNGDKANHDNITFTVGHWDGKQEPMSEDESTEVTLVSREPCYSSESMDDDENQLEIDESRINENTEILQKENREVTEVENNVSKKYNSTGKDRFFRNRGIRKRKKIQKPSKGVVKVQFKEVEKSVCKVESVSHLPPILKSMTSAETKSTVKIIRYDEPIKMLPEQVQILQQQLRQHIQLAASNFLQLYIHPDHWRLGPTYKEYLESLHNMSPTSVVHVCNLKPAVDLVRSWEESVSENTERNVEMVKFLQSEIDKCRRRHQINSYYPGDFHEMFKQVVANSPVFLYPYLLPPAPYRIECARRIDYRKSEDELIAIGLDQFRKYVDDNPEMFEKLTSNGRPRDFKGLNSIVELVCKYVVPAIDPKRMAAHVRRIKKGNHDDTDNPIYRYFHNNEITPVKHKLLPYNEKMTLYQQPAHEMPLLWVRYIAQTSKHARDFLKQRKFQVTKSDGVYVDIDVSTPSANKPITVETKQPVLAKFDRSVTWTPMNPIPIAPKNSTQENDKNTTSDHETLANNTKLTDTLVNDSSMRKRKKLPPNAVKKPQKLQTAPTIAPVSDKNTTKNKKELGPCPVQAGFYKVVRKDNVAMLVPVSAPSNTVTVNTAFKPITTAVIDKPKEPTAAVAEISTSKTVIKETESTKLQNVATKEPTQDCATAKVTEEKCEYLPHCKCCAVIRKIAKVKQKCITDYFKSKSTKRKKKVLKCPCNSINLPKISHRLWILVTSFHSHYLRVWREVNINTENLSMKFLEQVPRVYKPKEWNKSHEDINGAQFKNLDLNTKFEDLVLATSFSTKLMTRAGLKTKERIFKLFVHFNPTSENPLWLAREMNKCFHKGQTDLMNDFAAFLTADQAETIGCFKDYFVQNHMTELLKRVDAEITDKKLKYIIITKLNELLTERSPSCHICNSLLPFFEDYPQLADYLFSLFPHRIKMRKVVNKADDTKETKSLEKTSTDNNVARTVGEISTQSENNPDTLVAYEADNSSDSDDGECDNLVLNTRSIQEDTRVDTNTERETQKSVTVTDNETQNLVTVTESEIQDMYTAPLQSEIKQENTDDVMDIDELTVSKTEVQDCDSDSRLHLIMSEDESAKSEPCDWNKDEDKIILQMLKRLFTSDERKDLATVFENLEENNVFQMLSENLVDRSVRDIRERISYLLDLIVMVENNT